MNPLISVIIPYYKAEKYIDQCVESILSQTVKDIEILIAVDVKDQDGKTFLEAKNWPNTRIVWGGTDVSANRNAALDQAKGKYIFFIDADDFMIRSDAFEVMLRGIEENDSDMSVAEFDRCLDEEVKKLNPKDSLPKDCPDLIRTSEAMKIYLRETNLIFIVVWNILFKKEIIGEERFDEEMIVSEDDLYMLKILKKNPKIHLEKGFESYAHRSYRVTVTSQKPLLKRMGCWLKALEERESFVETNYPELKEQMKRYNATAIRTYLVELCSSFDKKCGSIKEAKRFYRTMRKMYLSYSRGIRSNLSGKNRIWDVLIRLNALWRIYRISRTVRTKNNPGK